jgi:hypothetical protein
MDCLKSLKRPARRFSTMDNALDWLERHKKEILIGTIVVVAGAVFVVVSAGTGVLVLTPLVAI